MGSGHDYDYLLPRGSLERFLLRMASVWPDWIAELQRGALCQRNELLGSLPAEAENGFVLHRDLRMRDRFHAEGGFEDQDGSSPINVWILGWDDTRTRVDFVIDLLPPSPFLGRVFDCVAQSIADLVMLAVQDGMTHRYFAPMDPGWVRANWPEVVKLETDLQDPLPMITMVGPGKGDPLRTCQIDIPREVDIAPSVAAHAERCIVRLLGYWHRVVYGTGTESFSMPPGDLRVRDGCIEVLAGGRPFDWEPQEVPAMFKGIRL